MRISTSRKKYANIGIIALGLHFLVFFVLPTFLYGGGSGFVHIYLQAWLQSFSRLSESTELLPALLAVFDVLRCLIYLLFAPLVSLFFGIQFVFQSIEKRKKKDPAPI